MRTIIDAIRQAITYAVALALITAIWICDIIDRHKGELS